MLIDALLAKLNLAEAKIVDHQSGYRNHNYHLITPDGERNLIIYKHETGILTRIQAANQLGLLLKDKLPVRYPLSPIIKIGTNRYACLYNYLPGTTIPWEDYHRKHLVEMGKTMAAIHLSQTLTSLPSAVKELASQHARMSQYLNQTDIKAALAKKLKLQLNYPQLQKLSLLPEHLTPLPTHNLHLDLVRGNLLWQGNLLVGLLDLEKASQGPAIVDLARSLAFLLTDCQHLSDRQIAKSFLDNGYCNRQPKPIAGHRYLKTLLIFYWLYDLYKFLLHNPYESLSANLHFANTKSKLLRYHLLNEL